MTTKEIVNLASSIAAVLGVVGMMLWGVPYYVDKQVENRLAELKAKEGTPSEVTALQQEQAVMNTKLDAVDATTKANGAKLDRLTENVLEVYRELANN